MTPKITKSIPYYIRSYCEEFLCVSYKAAYYADEKYPYVRFNAHSGTQRLQLYINNGDINVVIGAMKTGNKSLYYLFREKYVEIKMTKKYADYCLTFKGLFFGYLLNKEGYKKDHSYSNNHYWLKN